MTIPVIPASGAVSPGEMDRVLTWCAHERFTGLLTFESSVGEVSLPMRGGALDLGLDPSLVEVAESLRRAPAGRYTLTEALPPLEGASAMHPLRREGRLGPATFADLLRWCEDVALTGTVHLSVTRPEARSHVFSFVRGGLASVELESWSERDLSEVFALDEGVFVVRLTSRFGATTPSQMPPADDARARRDDLRAVRLGLEGILRKRDAASSGRWRCGSADAAPVARPSLAPVPPESAVVVYVLDPASLAARKAPPSDRTERLDAIVLPAPARPAWIAACVLGFLCVVAAGFGIAAGVDLLRS
ncbi:MAG: hypothetical protein R3A48_03100 [Polyangiales bacterium]